MDYVTGKKKKSRSEKLLRQSASERSGGVEEITLKKNRNNWGAARIQKKEAGETDRIVSIELTGVIEKTLRRKKELEGRGRERFPIKGNHENAQNRGGVRAAHWSGTALRGNQQKNGRALEVTGKRGRNREETRYTPKEERVDTWG